MGAYFSRIFGEKSANEYEFQFQIAEFQKIGPKTRKPKKMEGTQL